MTTKTSSFSMARCFAFYKNSLKRARGLGIFFGAITFLFFPLQYLISMGNRGFSLEFINEYSFAGVVPIYTPMAILFFIVQLIIPLVLALNIFSYLHSKQAVDVFHALPISRKELFLGNFAAGITIMAVSLLINFAIVGVISSIVFGGSIFLGVMLEMLIWLAICFTIFSITVFSTLNVGTIFDGFAYSMALLGGFSAIYGIIYGLCEMFVYGFSSESLSLEHIIKFSPISVMIERLCLGNASLKTINSNLWMILVWFLIGAALLVLSMRVYQTRKSEMAEAVGNMGILQVIVRAEAVFAGAIIIALFFASVGGVQNSELAFLVFTFLGALISYAIIELVLSRNAKNIIKSFPVGLGLSLATVAATACILFGFFGYENKLPNTSQVATVRIDYLGMYSNEYDWQYYDNYSRRNGVLFSSPESIQNVVDIHQTQIQNKTSDPYDTDDYIYGAPTFNIVYTLKNGSVIQRRYKSDKNNFENLVKLEANDELISQVMPIFTIDEASITSMTLYSYIDDEVVHTFAKTDHAKLSAALQADLLAITPELLMAGEKALAKVTYTYPSTVNNNTDTQAFASYDWKPTPTKPDINEKLVMVTENFKNTIAYLNSLGLGEHLVIDYADVSKIKINYYGRYYRNSVIANEWMIYDKAHDSSYWDYDSIVINNPDAVLPLILPNAYNIGPSNQRTVDMLLEFAENSYISYQVPYSALPASVQEQIVTAENKEN